MQIHLRDKGIGVFAATNESTVVGFWLAVDRRSPLHSLSAEIKHGFHDFGHSVDAEQAVSSCGDNAIRCHAKAPIPNCI